MTRLDVKSIFTNIPLVETIKNCIKELFPNNDTVHNLIKKDLKELRKCASYESFFTFDNKYCCPLDRVLPWDSRQDPLQRTYFFLCHFEKQWSSDCQQEFCSNIYKRHAGDTFVTFSSQEQLKKFVEYLKIKHQHIKFTFEHNNSFQFLDVKICRGNNKLTTSVYRKLTSSGVFTNFKSFIPTIHKFVLLYTLLHCCLNITSSHQV